MIGAEHDYLFYFPPDELDALAPHVLTFVARERVFGKRQVVNFLMHDTERVTVNANGEWTVDFIKPHFTCK